MELRNKQKGGFTDEIIFSSRVSASLLDIDEEGEELSDAEEEEVMRTPCFATLMGKPSERRIETGCRCLQTARGSLLR